MLATLGASLLLHRGPLDRDRVDEELERIAALARTSGESVDFTWSAWDLGRPLAI
jgi:hypothetical protein